MRAITELGSSGPGRLVGFSGVYRSMDPSNIESLRWKLFYYQVFRDVGIVNAD